MLEGVHVSLHEQLFEEIRRVAANTNTAPNMSPTILCFETIKGIPLSIPSHHQFGLTPQSNTLITLKQGSIPTQVERLEEMVKLYEEGIAALTQEYALRTTEYDELEYKQFQKGIESYCKELIIKEKKRIWGTADKSGRHSIIHYDTIAARIPPKKIELLHAKKRLMTKYITALRRIIKKLPTVGIDYEIDAQTFAQASMMKGKFLEFFTKVMDKAYYAKHPELVYSAEKLAVAAYESISRNVPVSMITTTHLYRQICAQSVTLQKDFVKKVGPIIDEGNNKEFDITIMVRNYDAEIKETARLVYDSRKRLYYIRNNFVIKRPFYMASNF